MEILITNDDGYKAKGIHILAGIMCQFGNVTVIAPKHHQSGMGMAVSLGLKQIAYKSLPDEKPGHWSYLDATPTSCIKFGLNMQFLHKKPDVIVSGINHGSNVSSGACYSGTLGAAQEGALCGIPSFGVSLSTIDPDADFSAVEQFFPQIFHSLMDSRPTRKGIYYNINFPDIPACDIRGIRAGYQGLGHWEREFREWDPKVFSKHGITPEMLGQSSEPKCEAGEKLYMMVGDFIDDDRDSQKADHHIIQNGYISVTPCNIDTTDYAELHRLEENGIETDFAD